MQNSKEKIENYLKDHSLRSDIGSLGGSCSIGAINIALGNGAVETVPEEVSPVIANWLMLSQDIMSDKKRNSMPYKKLLPELIGTTDGKDDKRIKILRKYSFTKIAKELLEDMQKIGFEAEFKKALRLKKEKYFVQLHNKIVEKIGYNNFDQPLNYLLYIATEEDYVKVARKVSMLMCMSDHYNFANYGGYYDKEVVGLLKKLIKA